MFTYTAVIFFMIAAAGHVIIKGHQINLWKLVAIYDKQSTGRVHIVKDNDGNEHRVQKLPEDTHIYVKGQIVDVRHRRDGDQGVYYLDGIATSHDMNFGIYMVYVGLAGFVLSAVLAMIFASDRRHQV